MKDLDSRMIWENLNSNLPGSPGRVGGGNIPYPDGQGEMSPEQPNGYTDTGFEEHQSDLEGAFKKALELNAQLPDEKKGEDYEEVHYNLIQAVKNFIEEIGIKIHN